MGSSGPLPVGITGLKIQYSHPSKLWQKNPHRAKQARDLVFDYALGTSLLALSAIAILEKNHLAGNATPIFSPTIDR
jgi:hypothetical protein